MLTAANLFSFAQRAYEMPLPVGHAQAGAIPLLLALALAAACSESTAPSGPSIQVSIVTTGADLDPDGFTVAIDDVTTRSVGVNETIVVRGVSAGTHNVWLKGIAANCVVNYQAPVVSVGTAGSGGGESPSVAFTVSCFTRSTPVALGSTQLLFVRDGQIYRTRADGTGLVVLDSGQTPAWSPDGQRIAFARAGDIYVMDANGANVQRVAVSPGFYFAPTWSPDGRQLAFSSDDIWDDFGSTWSMVVPISGATAPIRIPDSWMPAWSPDGSRIAVEAWGSGGGTAVWTVDPDGSNPVKLTDTGWWGAPAWSPDGKQIAISGGNSGLAVMNADGSGLRVLTRLPAGRPAWSPDGKQIAFSLEDACNEGCTRRVFYVTADGSTTGLLIENADSPSWHE